MGFPTTNEKRYFRTKNNELMVFSKAVGGTLPEKWDKTFDGFLELEKEADFSFSLKKEKYNRKYLKDNFKFRFPSDGLYQLSLVPTPTGDFYYIDLDSEIPSSAGAPTSGTVAIYEIKEDSTRKLLGSYYMGVNSSTPVDSAGKVAMNTGTQLKILTSEISATSLIEIIYIPSSSSPKEHEGIEVVSRFVSDGVLDDSLVIQGDKKISLSFNGENQFQLKIDGVASGAAIPCEILPFHTVSMYITRGPTNYTIKILIDNEVEVVRTVTKGLAMFSMAYVSENTRLLDLVFRFGERVYLHEVVKGLGYGLAYKMLSVDKKNSKFLVLNLTDDYDTPISYIGTIVIESSDDEHTIFLPHEEAHRFTIINKSNNNISIGSKISTKTIEIPALSTSLVVFNGAEYSTQVEQRLNKTDSPEFDVVTMKKLKLEDDEIELSDGKKISYDVGTDTLSIGDADTILEVDRINLATLAVDEIFLTTNELFFGSEGGKGLKYEENKFVFFNDGLPDTLELEIYNMKIINDLVVEGDAEVQGNFNVEEDVVIGSNLEVNGLSEFKDDVEIADDKTLDVKFKLKVGDESTFSGEIKQDRDDALVALGAVNGITITSDGTGTTISPIVSGIGNGDSRNLNYVHNASPDSTKWETKTGLFQVKKMVVNKGSGNIHEISFGSDLNSRKLTMDNNVFKFDKNVQAPTFNATSTREAKKNIKTFEKKALDIITQIEVVTYNFKEDEEGEEFIGVIAEDSPREILSETGKQVSITNSIAVLFKAVQELKQEIEILKKRII